MESNERSGGRIHLAHVDGLRGILALWVMMHHAWIQYWPEVTDPHPVGWLRAVQWLAFGHYAVVAFIVVSGFCLGLPVVRAGELAGGALPFYKRRIRRIIPPYYAATALSALLGLTIISQKTGTHWDTCLPVGWKPIVAGMLMVNDIKGGSVNHAFWSVAVECRIYLLFPLIVLAWKRLSRVQLLAAAVVLGYVPVLVMLSRHMRVLGSPNFLTLFVMGFVAAEAVNRRMAARATAGQAMKRWAVALAVVCVLMLEFLEKRWGYLTVGLAGALFALMLVISTLEREGWLNRLLSWRPIVTIGTFAYSIYLVHAPLLQVAWQLIRHIHMSASASFALMLSVGCPLIVCASYLFFFAFERPFLRSRAPRPVPAAAAPEAAAP